MDKFWINLKHIDPKFNPEGRNFPANIYGMKALIRRRHFAGKENLEFMGISVDTAKREVSATGKQISLTRSEYDILLFFLTNQGRVLSRESIAEHIWGDNMDMADSFDFIYSHIKNLRKKISAAGVVFPIHSVYGIGYKLETT